MIQIVKTNNDTALLAKVPYDNLARFVNIVYEYGQLVGLTFQRKDLEEGVHLVLMKVAHSDINPLIKHCNSYTKIVNEKSKATLQPNQ